MPCIFELKSKMEEMKCLQVYFFPEAQNCLSLGKTLPPVSS